MRLLKKPRLYPALLIVTLLFLCSGTLIHAQMASQPNANSAAEIVQLLVGPAEKSRVITLEVPKSYFWNPTKELKRLTPYPGDAEEASRSAPSTRNLILELLLPNFDGRSSENEREFRGGISNNTIILEVWPNRGEAEGLSVSGEPIVDSTFRRHREMLVTSYDRKRGIALQTKPDRFGLKHEGAVTDFEPYRCGVGNVNDIYYPSEDPKQSFLICGAEEIKDVQEDARSCRHPICTQYFYSRDTQSTIKLNYRRIHISHWRQLQGEAERLLQTMKKD